MPSKQLHSNASMVAACQTVLWNFHSHFTQSDTNVKLLQKQSWMQSVATWPLKQWFIHLNAKYNLGSMSLKSIRTNICIGDSLFFHSWTAWGRIRTHTVIPRRSACQAPDCRRAQGLRTQPPAAHLGNGQCILLCTYGLSLEWRKSAWNVPKITLSALAEILPQ